MTSKRPLPDQKVLLCGLDCKPGQEDLFPPDGPPDPADGNAGNQEVDELDTDEDANET